MKGTEGLKVTNPDAPDSALRRLTASYFMRELFGSRVRMTGPRRA
jgi:hypothetical protein